MPLRRDDLTDAIGEEERDRREESSTRRLLKAARAEVVALEHKVDLLTTIDAVQCSPAEWAQPRAAKGHRGIANLMLSDLHLDEVVDAGEMRDKNAYNREIAAQRIRRLGDNTITMARDYVSGVTYDGLYLWCNGDFVSGNIHEELRQTNAGDVVDTVDYWIDPIAELIDQLADHFGKVHLVWSYGNHGRSTQKPQSKGAVRSSFDWLLARILYRQLRNDERLTWNIPEARDVRETHYGKTRYLMTHGDGFPGGDQIAGAVRPVMMGDYRTLVVEIADGEPYDRLLVGHFHQYTTLPRATINGSLIGYNEYAKDRKLRPEPPAQAFWLTTPEHGPSFYLPIFVANRKKEGW